MLGRGVVSIGMALVIIGAIVILVGIALGLHAYYYYTPVLPPAESLQQSLTYTVYELLNLVIRLAFLGVVIWGGSLLIKHGISYRKIAMSQGEVTE